MSLFRLDASIRVEGSHSRELVRRHVGTQPVPATARGAAAFAGYTPEDQRSPEQLAALALAAELTDELVGADALLVVVRGGAYGAGTPREGWDHSTVWIRRILEDVWALDLKIVEVEFTLADVNPAMAEFRDLAHQLRTDGEQLAREHGRSLGGKLAA